MNVLRGTGEVQETHPAELPGATEAASQSSHLEVTPGLALRGHLAIGTGPKPYWYLICLPEPLGIR